MAAEWEDELEPALDDEEFDAVDFEDEEDLFGGDAERYDDDDYAYDDEEAEDFYE